MGKVRERLWLLFWDGLPLGPLRRYNLGRGPFLFSICPWVGLQEMLTFFQIRIDLQKGICIHLLPIDLDLDWDSTPYDPGE